ncbi:MAG: 3-deoxy-D-manno-octulosonate 8-phosphate phosphatase [Acutalibacteraceae bacterium]
MIINKDKFESLRKNIKIIVLDVDGTLTDGKIYMGKDGELFKAFDIKDGCAIHDIMPKNNIVPIIMTARKSEIVINRCKELGITEYYQGVRNKLEKLKEIAVANNLAEDNGIYKQIAYVGDDIIDLECMKHCGLVACPADAVAQVKEISDFISERNGGNGAVREFVEALVKL